MENVAWIVNSGNPEFVSSYRYNAYIPANELGGQVLTYSGDDDPSKFLTDHALKIIIICKPFISDGKPSEDHPFVRLAKKCKEVGVLVCFHICDWHFNLSVYKILAEISDQIVVQTKYIAKAVEEIYGRTPVIIEEPFEGPRGKVRFKPRKTLKLMWFGHSSNLDTLSVGLQQLYVLNQTFKLTIMTNDFDMAVECFDNVPKPPYLIERNIIEFSLERQWRELELTDIVIIPGFFAKEKNIKGHNRLIQCLQSGRLAVVFPLPQYQELSDYCVCSEDLAAGINWALQNKTNVFQGVKAGQQYIDQRFSPSAVAARWQEEVSKVLSW